MDIEGCASVGGPVLIALLVLLREYDFAHLSDHPDDSGHPHPEEGPGAADRYRARDSRDVSVADRSA
ncbi:hypothetical protein SDC9_135471 [bioreactor metagenome]|uniref:Uncharacterized protein n=1 Tax=bioreactor metagenome TaxID=1076179 RepID=A0A645DH54_9ZZZZ